MSCFCCLLKPCARIRRPSPSPINPAPAGIWDSTPPWHQHYVHPRNRFRKIEARGRQSYVARGLPDRMLRRPEMGVRRGPPTGERIARHARRTRAECCHSTASIGRVDATVCVCVCMRARSYPAYPAPPSQSLDTGQRQRAGRSTYKGEGEEDPGREGDARK